VFRIAVDKRKMELVVPKLIRREPTGLEAPAEELLLAARNSSRRLYVALTVVLSLNFAVISGALTFWALVFRK